MTYAPEITDFSMDWFSLKGKVAIVTGANKGLGMGYALAFAKAGADLFIPCHSDDWGEIKALIEAEGRRAVFLQGDLRDRDYLYSIPEKCLEAYGQIDILVNNAGTNCFEEFLDFPDEGWDRVMAVNLDAVYLLGHAVAKVMAKQGRGKIINIGSALSYTGDAKCPAYITAKHGVIGITRSFANELGRYNIQCNAVCPGFIYTDVLKAIADPEFMKHINDRISLGRWGTLGDLMGTVVFLASRASDYVNGADIRVDGGFSTVL
jgi:Dehydrogenases with different specificities (related to short-chain alcohol dehydrogenases)